MHLLHCSALGFAQTLHSRTTPLDDDAAKLPDELDEDPAVELDEDDDDLLTEAALDEDPAVALGEFAS